VAGLEGGICIGSAGNSEGGYNKNSSIWCFGNVIDYSIVFYF
jgi:hypothetical protein